MVGIYYVITITFCGQEYMGLDRGISITIAAQQAVLDAPVRSALDRHVGAESYTIVLSLKEHSNGSKLEKFICIPIRGACLTEGLHDNAACALVHDCLHSSFECSFASTRRTIPPTSLKKSSTRRSAPLYRIRRALLLSILPVEGDIHIHKFAFLYTRSCFCPVIPDRTLFKSYSAPT
jgi:hypothetical protein